MEPFVLLVLVLLLLLVLLVHVVVKVLIASPTNLKTIFQAYQGHFRRKIQGGWYVSIANVCRRSRCYRWVIVGPFLICICCRFAAGILKKPCCCCCGCFLFILSLEFSSKVVQFHHQLRHQFRAGVTITAAGRR
uniref:Putative plasma membrane protein n=1 Tax=Anopheles darlingi TaxID=43151 RepID=A0A2M4CZZ9_ANODA